MPRLGVRGCGLTHSAAARAPGGPAVQIAWTNAANYGFTTIYPPTGSCRVELWDSSQTFNLGSLLFLSGNPGDVISGDWIGGGQGVLTPSTQFFTRNQPTDAAANPVGSPGPWAEVDTQGVEPPHAALSLTTAPTVDPSASTGNSDGGPLDCSIQVGGLLVYDGDPNIVLTGSFDTSTGSLVINGVTINYGPNTYAVVCSVGDWIADTDTFVGSPSNFVVTDNGDGSFSLSLS